MRGGIAFVFSFSENAVGWCVCFFKLKLVKSIIIFYLG